MIEGMIAAPDIRDTDKVETKEWLNRQAKVLLKQSWQGPKHWGTRSGCINMTESIGFIIGEYTIPSDLPVIYITD
jgi:hypothetical protein